jgi:hypothetical protein
LVTVNLGCVPQGSGADACPGDNGDHDHSFAVDGFGGFVEVTDENDGFADANFDYSAAADAQYGILHARASGTFSGLTPNAPTSIRGAGAFAAVTDLLTITAPGQTGSASLAVSMLLEGMLQKSAGAGAFAFAAVTAGPNPDAFDSANTGVAFDSILTVPSGPFTATVPFEWGTPFYLSLIMGVGAGTPVSCALCVSSGDSNATPATTASGSATADFFDTLTLTGLLPTDNDDPTHPVRTAQFSAASNAVYTTNGIVAQPVPVPEPASLLLLGSGLAYTFRRRSRR